LDGHDITKCEVWISNTTKMNPNREDVGRLLELIASENSFDTYIEKNDVVYAKYCNDYVKENYSKILDDAARVLFSVDVSHTHYKIISTSVRRFLIGSADRCYRGGEKEGSYVKMMLVLEGNQNIGKSTAVSIMAGDPEFFEEVGEVDHYKSVDNQMKMQGKTFIEIPESLFEKRSDVKYVKALISQRVFRARLPYTKSVVDLKIRYMLMASMNLDATETYLKDMTGNVRFFPIPCGYGKNDTRWKINFEEFKENWNIILAAAIHAWKLGEQHWLTDDEEELHREYVSTKEVENIYDRYLIGFLNQEGAKYKEDGIKMNDFKRYVFDFEGERRFDNNSASNALKKFGFENQVFTMTPEEKFNLPGRTSIQIKLWIIKGTFEEVRRKRNVGSGEVSDEYSR
ncbi:MAG TPA: VapE domain-containing protein, partial [Chitinophagaceae bacterium]